MSKINLVEGEIISKRRPVRFLFAFVIFMFIFVITVPVIYINLAEVTKDKNYKIVFSETQPTPDSTRIEIKGQTYNAWEVPKSREDINKSLMIGGLTLAGALFALYLLIRYANKKDRYIVKDGRLIIEPEDYLRQDTSSFGWFLTGLGIINVIGIYFFPEIAKGGIGYGGAILLIFLGLISLFATRLPNRYLKKMYTFFIVVGTLSYVYQFITTGKISFIESIFILVYYSILIKKIKDLQKMG